ncbi:DUF916 and DUF3324 domain-containing protein [Enterococcus sp. LJL51]|uniref:DUF916 and DUF3324 domain-containing protein n=1 Tax=Enterococcus sp. LJL51 TaxID=3416656 RepID=UPI003CF229AD
MKNKYQKIASAGLISFILFLGLGIFSLPVQAESLDSFDALPHFTESQTNKELSYFDVKLEPEQKELLVVTLVNKSDKPLTLKASFNRAVTNSAGVIEYSGINKDTSTSAPYDIEKLVKLSTEEITLEPQQTKDITLDITMPKEKFAGVLAGGIYLEALSDEKVEGNVKNVFSREIAVLIRSDGTETEPDLSIETAKADQVNYRNVIEVGIENKAAVYIKNVAIEYSVLLDGKEVLQGKKEKLSIAPNTLFPFRIPFSGEEFGAGEYTVNISVATDKKQWKGSPTFTIDGKEAADFNDKDVTVKKSGFDIPWSTVSLAAVLLILAVVTALVINKNKKLKKELARKRRKKKRPVQSKKQSLENKDRKN